MSTDDISVKFVGEVADYLREEAARYGMTVGEVVAEAIALHQLYEKESSDA